jgi:facilitated trehalose transporter
MALPLASLGAFFYMFSDPETSHQEWRSNLQWVPLVCLIIYMIGYSIGFACVPFILLGEMLPGKEIPMPYKFTFLKNFSFLKKLIFYMFSN